MNIKKMNEKKTLTRRVIDVVVGNLRASAGLLLIVLVIAATSAQAQKTKAKQAATKPDTDAAMLETLKAMQKELGEIKVLLAARPPQQRQAPANAPAGPQQSVLLDMSNRPFRGDKNAPITIVEITDYQCPFCARHVRDTMPQIVKDYIDTGKVKYYVLDLPLESIHPHAFKAAAAVRCANDQGKYWEMHDLLFANQKTLAQWDAHAATLGLDAAQFSSCLSSGKFDADVRKDIGQAQVAGVSRTPGFYFGTSDAKGTKVKTMKFVVGAQPYTAMKPQIEALLNTKIEVLLNTKADKE